MYCINPESDEPIFLLDAPIGQDEKDPAAKYIDGTLFARELMYMDGEGKKRIWVYINSPGGLVDEGTSIYAAILLTKTKVNTFCVGQAASMAGVIFQAGRQRLMLESATLMYHEAYTDEPTENQSKSLKAINDAIAKMIDTRSWKDIEAVKKMMKLTTYISADDALASGLCDEVVKNAELNSKPAKNLDETERFQLADKFLNKVKAENKPIKKPTMSKAVAKSLGLNEDASDESIAKALEEIKAKAKKSDEDYEEKKKALAKAEDELAKAKKKMEDDEEMEKKKNAEDAEAKALTKASEDKAAAKAKILETAKNRGVVLSEKAIEQYTSLGSTGAKALESVVETINEMPVGKKAPIVNLGTGAAGKDEKLYTVNGKDENGMDKIVDTSKAVAEMNKQVFAKSKERFK